MGAAPWYNRIQEPYFNALEILSSSNLISVQGVRYGPAIWPSDPVALAIINYTRNSGPSGAELSRK